MIPRIIILTSSVPGAGKKSSKCDGIEVSNPVSKSIGGCSSSCPS